MYTSCTLRTLCVIQYLYTETVSTRVNFFLSHSPSSAVVIRGLTLACLSVLWHADRCIH